MDKKDSFIQAIQENEGLIYKVATFYTNSNDDRDDLVQEIIYSLWNSFDSFKGNSSLSTWMYRVAMNNAIFHLKKRRKRISTIPIEISTLNTAETVDDHFEERSRLLQEQIKDLNLLDKGILMLYLENKSHEEIAEIIGISKTNVGTKLSRIKEKLKQQILKKF